jgi:hypothetical protein
MPPSSRLGLVLGTIVLAALAIPAAAWADFDPEAWRFVRAVEVPEGATGAHARLRLDEHVWDHAAGPDLRDLRVVRGAADVTGYAVYVPEKPAATRQERPARVLNVATQGTEASQLVLDLGEAPPVTNRVRIETPADNFRCPVTVEGSDDGQAWKTLRDDAAIFAFTGEVVERFTEVSFPDATFRYLRLVVGAPAGAEPIDLAGATVWQEVVPPSAGLPLLVKRPVRARTQVAGDRETRYTLDLGAKHLPVGRVTLETAEANFSRPVRIEVSDEKKQWRPAGSGIVFRYRTSRYRSEQMALEFPETFGRYLRLTVRDGDDPPLAVADLAVHGRPRYVFFPFESGRQYRLFYGNPGAAAPQYDYAKVLPRLDPGEAVAARAGPATANPRFIATREAPEPHPWLVRNQWVLYLALGVAVLALVLIAARALRRPPPEEGSGG